MNTVCSHTSKKSEEDEKEVGDFHLYSIFFLESTTTHAMHMKISHTKLHVKCPGVYCPLHYIAVVVVVVVAVTDFSYFGATT